MLINIIEILNNYLFIDNTFLFRLLIGAPRAKALPKHNANVSGGLYRCKFTQSNDCERIKVDIKGWLCFTYYYFSAYFSFS